MKGLDADHVVAALTLDRWSKLAADVGIDRWAAHGGSIISAKCFQSINPWDDDIDVSIPSCGKLDSIWAASPNVSRTSLVKPSVYNIPGRWDSRWTRSGC